MGNYDFGQPIDLDITAPPFIPSLTDDTLRSVDPDISYTQDNAFGTAEAGYLRREVEGEVLYFREFYWANYLRPLVYRDTAGTANVTAGMDPSAPNVFTNYDELTIFSVDLARDPAVSSVPDYMAIVREPTVTLLLMLSTAMIIVCVRARQLKIAG